MSIVCFQTTNKSTMFNRLSSKSHNFVCISINVWNRNLYFTIFYQPKFQIIGNYLEIEKYVINTEKTHFLESFFFFLNQVDTEMCINSWEESVVDRLETEVLGLKKTKRVQNNKQRVKNWYSFMGEWDFNKNDEKFKIKL